MLAPQAQKFDSPAATPQVVVSTQDNSDAVLQQQASFSLSVGGLQSFVEPAIFLVAAELELPARPDAPTLKHFAVPLRIELYKIAGCRPLRSRRLRNGYRAENWGCLGVGQRERRRGHRADGLEALPRSGRGRRAIPGVVEQASRLSGASVAEALKRSSKSTRYSAGRKRPRRWWEFAGVRRIDFENGSWCQNFRA